MKFFNPIKINNFIITISPGIGNVNVFCFIIILADLLETIVVLYLQRSYYESYLVCLVGK